MNILLGGRYAAPNSGNFIASLLELGNYLKARGHGVCYAFTKCEHTMKPGGWVNWLEKNGFTVYLVDEQASDESQLSELKGILEKEKIDIFHSHFWLFHSIIVNYRNELPVKILLHEHMERPAWFGRFKYWKKMMLRSAMYRKKHISIICVNKKVSRCHRLTQHWWVPNGLSFLRNVDKSTSREECRNSLHIPPDEKIVLFMGHNPSQKGLDIAVRAIEKLQDESMSVKLGLLGFGANPSGDRLKVLEKIIKNENDRNALFCLEGGEDMFALHRAADCYLSASRSESFSYGLIEAISQNTPIVVSNIRGTRWSAEFSNSYFYPVEDPDACAEQIKNALKTGRIESNYEEIIEKYSIDKWCERILQIYKKLM